MSAPIRPHPVGGVDYPRTFQELQAWFPDDRACLRWVSATSGKTEPTQVTFGWIRNTLALDRLAISENLRGLIDGLPHIVVEEPFEVRWDDGGNLVSPF